MVFVHVQESGASGIVKKLINNRKWSQCFSVLGFWALHCSGAGGRTRVAFESSSQRSGGREDTMWGHGLELFSPRNIPAAPWEQSDPLSWLLS